MTARRTNPFKTFALAVALAGLLPVGEMARAERKVPGKVPVREGMYSPLFREPDESDRKIAAFFLDERPVTRESFAVFLKTHPQFLKDRVSKRMADASYLEAWQGAVFPPGTARQPVTSVSWFAARAYCKSVGGRLPNVDEWEFAAQAQRPENLKIILAWYEKPADQLDTVDSLKNDPATGLSGMHGLIWEWTEDFASVLLQGDSRSSNDTSGGAFCGAGVLKAKRPEEYATFMRFAFRSSLKASSSARALGFRCAYDK